MAHNSWKPPDLASNGQAGASDAAATTLAERAYLEAIWHLGGGQGLPRVVSPWQLVRWMHVSGPTVTLILQRLAAKALVTHTDRRGVLLTRAGLDHARQIARRRLLVECFLFEVLHVPWHRVYQEATRLEPWLSDTLEAAIVRRVGGRQVCPHGTPLPDTDSVYPPLICLAHAPLAEGVTLVRVDEALAAHPLLAQWLERHALLPGTALRVAPPHATGTVVVRGDGLPVRLAPEVARGLFVRVER